MPNELPQSSPFEVESQEAFLDWLLSTGPASAVQLVLDGAAEVAGLDQGDAAAVAQFLRSSPASLEELGIAPNESAPTVVQKTLWLKLRQCLCQADENDGMVIFKAMVQALEGHSMADCVPLMKDVFSCPWRIHAIESEPGFFLVARTEPDVNLTSLSQYAANAFQVLAQTEFKKEVCFDSMLETIMALKYIGVKDFPNPNGHKTCLHLAILFQETELCAAFLQEFPEAAGAKTQCEDHPLHFAALSKHAGNIRRLIEVGADPRPINGCGETPMQLAAKSQWIHNVMALIDTGAYNDHDVHSACEKFEDDDAERLRSYYAAVRAHQSMCAVGNGDTPRVIPLQ